MSKMQILENETLDVAEDMSQRIKYDLKNYVYRSPMIIELASGNVIDGIYRSTRPGGSSIVLEMVSEFPSKNCTGARVPVCYSAYEIRYLHTFDEDNSNKVCPALSGLSHQDFLKAKELICDVKYVPVYDCNFENIIKEIKMHDVIGILGVGSHILKVRYSRISCFLITTREKIYLFDIQYTPKNFWEMGLKSILEDQKIQKVVYDSKTIADILANRYEVKLLNVFDVMVADYDICKQNHNFKTLPELLQTYLNLPQGMFAYTELVLSGETYKQRPLVDKMKRDLALGAAFLINLRNTQNAILLKEFILFTSEYTNSVKNCPDLESLDSKLKDAQLLPEIISLVQDTHNENLQTDEASGYSADTDTKETH